MRFGFHISIAGGFRNVISRAKERRCATIQLFSRNPRGWKYKRLERDDIQLFRQGIKKENIAPIFVHMPYLPNLASSEANLCKRSVDALIEDLERSEIIGAQYLIVHIGSSEDVRQGTHQMTVGINRALNSVKNSVVLVLENTAGSGNELGYSFDQIRDIIAGVKDRARIGVVLDTAHAFEAGYDLRTPEAVDKMVDAFNTKIGLKKLHLIHLNDSKTELGSRSDRHWHIGQGEIGDGMRHILHHPSLRKLPFIMETPRKELKDDLMNLKIARKFAREVR